MLSSKVILVKSRFGILGDSRVSGIRRKPNQASKVETFSFLVNFPFQLVQTLAYYNIFVILTTSIHDVLSMGK
jgi:hypothetical protein